MSRFTDPMSISPPWARRAVTIAALAGATILAAPLAMAQGVPAPLQLAQASPQSPSAAPSESTSRKPPAAAEATSERPQTVEQRITQLHQELQITPKQESKWNDVAQAMRDNAANMEKLVAEKRQKGPENMNAVQDLETYRDFAQAHVDGLKKLTSAFRSLYDSMPDAQKKHADEVFAQYGRDRAQTGRQG